MSDTSTAQPNWVHLSNPLSVKSLPNKEFVELPLLSTYNNAFLETITEEGSEFEPSEDGSASFEQSDYLPLESTQMEQGTGPLVRVDPSLMIGEIDSPDYEEVFPMPIPSFANFTKDLFDYSNLIIPSHTKANSWETFNTTQSAERINWSNPINTVMNPTETNVVRPQSTAVGAEIKSATNRDDLEKTPDYQRDTETDAPEDIFEDWGDGLILNQTPGRTETMKRAHLRNTSSIATEHDEVFEPMKDQMNPVGMWIDAVDGRSEDMLVLAPVGEDKKLVWKLESGTSEHLVTGSTDPNDFPQCIAQVQTGRSVSNDTSEHGNEHGKSQVLETSARNEALCKTTVTNDIGASNGHTTITKRSNSMLHPIGVMPAVPRPNLPAFCSSNPITTSKLENKDIPPPKPYFPRNGMPEGLFGHSKITQSLPSSAAKPLLSTPPVLPMRSTVAPSPNFQPNIQVMNPLFPPTVSYRELLSTAQTLNDPFKVPKSQSLHSTFTTQTFQPTYSSIPVSMSQSATLPLITHSPTFNSNLETHVNPMISSFPGCQSTSLLGFQTFMHSYWNNSTVAQYRPSSSMLSKEVQNVRPVMHDPVNTLFDNPAYTSTYIPESDQTFADVTNKMNQFASTKNVPFRGRPNGPGDHFSNQSLAQQPSITTSKEGESSRISRVAPEVKCSGHPGPISMTQSKSAKMGHDSPKSPLWIANSTPLAHYYASHSAIQEKTDTTATLKSNTQKPVSSLVPENRSIVSDPVNRNTAVDCNRKTHPQISDISLINPIQCSPHPRPIQRSFAVVGVSELLAKTDEELSKFMQTTEKQNVLTKPDVTDELSTESSGNQPSSISGGLVEQSPIRRRFQLNRVGPAPTMRLDNSVEVESDIYPIDRRSFYDYGCDDDDEEDEDEDVVVSESELDSVRRTLLDHRPTGRSTSTAITSSGTDEIIRQLNLLNQSAQFVWSDNCHAQLNSSDGKPIRELDELLSQWDVPFIDSDSLVNESWANNSSTDAWRMRYLRKPIRANLDEITLTSDRTSSKLSWGSTNALDYMPLGKEAYRRTGSTELLENEYDDVLLDKERRRPGVRSRRGCHSYDSFTQPKRGSRLQKFTAPWLRRLCGCVRPSRFRRKESV